MKYVMAKLFFVLIVACFFTGCDNGPNAPISVFSGPSTPYPTKEIFATEGSVSNPYLILGPVEYTLSNSFSFFSGPEEIRARAVEYLKQEALARYGNKVDAIIEIEFQDGTEQGFFKPNVTYAKGLAIAFKEAGRPRAKPKKKHKVKPTTKNSVSKPKPSIKTTPRKTAPEKPEEREITPSEILK